MQTAVAPFLQPVKRMWPAGRQRVAPPRGGSRRGPGSAERRRLRWQLLALLAAAAGLLAYDRSLDRSQDVFRPLELDVLGVPARPPHHMSLCSPLPAARVTPSKMGSLAKHTEGKP